MTPALCPYRSQYNIIYPHTPKPCEDEEVPCAVPECGKLGWEVRIYRQLHLTLPCTLEKGHHKRALVYLRSCLCKSCRRPWFLENYVRACWGKCPSQIYSLSAFYCQHWPPLDRKSLYEGPGAFGQTCVSFAPSPLPPTAASAIGSSSATLMNVKGS